MSRWRWVGVAFMDDEGNIVGWEVDRPNGTIVHGHTMMGDKMVFDALTLRLEGRMKRWTGQVPNQPVAIAQYPPLPIDSEE